MDRWVAAVGRRGTFGALPQQASHQIVPFVAHDFLAWRVGSAELVDATLQFHRKQAKKTDAFNEKVKVITRRNNPVNLA